MMGIISSRPPAGVARPQRIRVSQGVSEALLIKRMDPEYPDSARQKHVEGTVTLGAVIDKNGDVGQLSVVSGPMLLVPSALEVGPAMEIQALLVARGALGHADADYGVISVAAAIVIELKADSISRQSGQLKSG
jgi:hypothetical protein